MINYSAQSASVSYGCCSKPCLKTTEKLEHITLSEMSDRERQMPYDITYIWNLKNNTNKCIYKTEINSETQKASLWLPEKKREGCQDKLGAYE